MLIELIEFGSAKVIQLIDEQTIEEKIDSTIKLILFDQQFKYSQSLLNHRLKPKLICLTLSSIKSDIDWKSKEIEIYNKLNQKQLTNIVELN